MIIGFSGGRIPKMSQSSKSAFSSDAPAFMPGAALEPMIAGRPTLGGPPAASTQAITVDVFDTLLLRRPTSQKGRRWQLAVRLSALAAKKFPERHFEPVQFYYTRERCEILAFKAQESHGTEDEVRHADVLSDQADLLGLPQDFVAAMQRTERELELDFLRPNKALLDMLAQARAGGIATFAISDTILSAEDVTWLIERTCGVIPVDKVYTSADMRCSKRVGGLFKTVLAAENLTPRAVLHIGDDADADHFRAKEAGIVAMHVPRRKAFIYRRKLNALRHSISHYLRKAPNSPPSGSRPTQYAVDTRQGFGRYVLGPMVAEYTMMADVYLRTVARQGGGTALFCSRGGLLMKTAIERYYQAVGRKPPVPLKSFMVSRLVATRLCLQHRPTVAFDEITREFKDSTMAQAMESIVGEPVAFSQVWDKPVTRDQLHIFLASEDGAHFLRLIKDQNELFERHIEECVGESRRVVLVDTGLFGSTLQMLQYARPDLQWECLLLARSNYKGLPTPHFDKVTAVWTQRNGYSPFHPRSSVLRYWQFIEALFEPELQSVKTFQAKRDRVVSNLERLGWQRFVESPQSELFRGVLSYLDDMSADRVEEHYDALNTAWRLFSDAVRFPGLKTRELLEIGDRSRDYGRDATVSAANGGARPTLADRFRRLKSSIWRAGSAVDLFPVSHPAVQFSLEIAYWGLWIRKRLLG